MAKRRVHVDDTPHESQSDLTNHKPDDRLADEEDHDQKLMAGVEHLMSMKDAVKQRLKILDDYAYYRQAKDDNANWFRALTHLKRNIHVDDHGICQEVRENVIEFMEKPKSEVFILMLVLTDMVMVIIEGVIDSTFNFDYGGGSRRLAGIGKDATCNIEHAYNIANSCRIVSITILCAFALELVVKFVCAPKGFCRHFGHILDVIVVGGSLVFEFTLHHSAGALLIFFRCWRGVRILHGLYEQIEYISKALETEAHLEHALGTVNKYKAFTHSLKIRKQWKIFKHQQRSSNILKDLHKSAVEDVEENIEEGALRSMEDVEEDIEVGALRSAASPTVVGNCVTVEEIDGPNLT